MPGRMTLQPANRYRSKARKLLRAHIVAHWESQAAFAREIDASEHTVSHYLSGRRKPDLDSAIRIELVTTAAGEPIVRCVDWREGKK
jgi:hypothetical protein